MNKMTPREFFTGLDFPGLGSIEINGKKYNNLQEAKQYLQEFTGMVKLSIQTSSQINTTASKSTTKMAPQSQQEVNDETLYRIRVRQYMTKPSSPTFNFMAQWNNDQPMPMRIMVGRKLKETKGMIKMELWGQMTNETEDYCMRCGRILTNPVSKYFGIGPECGNHNYTNPFKTDEELKVAIEENNEKLAAIKWTGWVIKSAIEEEEIVK